MRSETEYEPRFQAPSAAVAVAILTAIALLLGVLAAIGWARVFATATQPPPSAVLEISACAPSDFGDGSCVGDPPVSPGVLTASPEARVPVAGRVRMIADRDVAFQVTVSWVAVESSAAFQVIDVPVVYEAGRDEPYEIEWSIPPLLLDLLPCEPTRWRIVGRATPIDDPAVQSYTWDSAKTFTVDPSPSCLGASG